MREDEAPLPPPSAGLRRITAPISVAVFAVAAAGIAVAASHGTSAAVITGAAAALAVAALGTVATHIRWHWAAGPSVVVMAVVGLAGAVLAALLPDTTGFVIVYLALAGLGMRLPPRPVPALAAGLVVFAALDIGLLTAPVSVANLLSLDIGAVFVFAVGAFARSA